MKISMKQAPHVPSPGASRVALETRMSGQGEAMGTRGEAGQVREDAYERQNCIYT